MTSKNPHTSKALKKRMHERFRPKHPVFVKLALDDQEDMGQLIEISKGGLSIRYFVDEERTRSFSELSIYSSDGVFAVEGIPIKNISDSELKDLPFETEILRRHGIKFEEMTPDQILKLEDFLANYTEREY